MNTVIVECPLCKGTGQDPNTSSGHKCPHCDEGRFTARLWTPDVEQEHQIDPQREPDTAPFPKPWENRNGRALLGGRVCVGPVGSRWKVAYRLTPTTPWVVHRLSNGRTYYTRSLETALALGKKFFDQTLTPEQREIHRFSELVDTNAAILAKYPHPSSWHPGKTLLDYSRWMIANDGGSLSHRWWVNRVRNKVEGVLHMHARGERIERFERERVGRGPVGLRPT